MADVQRVVAVGIQVGAELQQIGAVGLQRVARQASLELEVGEEVEHQLLERARRGGGDCHGATFAPREASPLVGSRAQLRDQSPQRCEISFERCDA